MQRVQTHETHRALTLVVAVVVVFALVAILAACGDDDTVTGGPGRVFTEEDTTSEALVEAGERFEIRLPSNPSTGYSWVMSPMATPGLVELVSSSYTAEDTDLVGVAGTEVWVFAAGEEGAGVLRLEYIRPFEERPVPERVFELIVRIDGAEWGAGGGS
jgi:inhibitor of cysteine peptidase